MNGQETEQFMIAYTPDCLGKLSQRDLEKLHDHGYPIPLSQLPEFHGSLRGEGDPLRVTMVTGGESVREEEEEEDWSMYLNLNPGFVKIATAGQTEDNGPLRRQLRKAEVVYTRGIEEILSNLTGPLEVTYTVSPDEVTPQLGSMEACD